MAPLLSLGRRPRPNPQRIRAGGQAGSRSGRRGTEPVPVALCEGARLRSHPVAGWLPFFRLQRAEGEAQGQGQVCVAGALLPSRGCCSQFPWRLPCDFLACWRGLKVETGRGPVRDPGQGPARPRGPVRRGRCAALGLLLPRRPRSRAAGRGHGQRALQACGTREAKAQGHGGCHVGAGPAAVASREPQQRALAVFPCYTSAEQQRVAWPTGRQDPRSLSGPL